MLLSVHVLPAFVRESGPVCVAGSSLLVTGVSEPYKCCLDGIGCPLIFPSKECSWAHPEDLPLPL